MKKIIIIISVLLGVYLTVGLIFYIINTNNIKAPEKIKLPNGLYISSNNKSNFLGKEFIVAGDMIITRGTTWIEHNKFGSVEVEATIIYSISKSDNKYMNTIDMAVFTIEIIEIDDIDETELVYKIVDYHPKNVGRSYTVPFEKIDTNRYIINLAEYAKQ